MKYAIEDFRKIINANDAFRGRRYSCPYCEAGVFLREGYSRESHFAHNKGEGRPECEEYHPSEYTNIASNYDKPEVEDKPKEIGLSFASTKPWSLLLRLPEIPNEELGQNSLSTLINAYIEIYANNCLINKIDALSLKPGVVNFLVDVPPANEWILNPGGKWPQDNIRNKWFRKINGVNLKGSFFRLHKSEWIRLRNRSPIEWGESLCFVADKLISIPQDCEVNKIGYVEFSGYNWAAWYIKLPTKPTGKVDNWLKDRSHFAIKPSWKSQIISPIYDIEFLNNQPNFLAGSPFILSLNPPPDIKITDAPSLFVKEGTNKSRYTLYPSPHNSIFCKVSLVNTDYNVTKTIYLGSEHDKLLDFKVVPPPSLSELRSQVSNLPKLQISIGNKTIKAWDSCYEIIAPPTGQDIPSILVNYGPKQIDFLLSIHWSTKGQTKSQSNLPAEKAKDLISKLIEYRQPVYITIDAGALGKIELQVKPSEEKKKEETPSSNHLINWLSVISAIPQKHILHYPYLHITNKNNLKEADSKISKFATVVSRVNAQKNKRKIYKQNQGVSY